MFLYITVFFIYSVFKIYCLPDLELELPDVVVEELLLFEVPCELPPDIVVDLLSDACSLTYSSTLNVSPL